MDSASEQDGAATDGAPRISTVTQQIGVMQARLAALESQHGWLHLEQLRVEVASLRQSVAHLVEYLAERDGLTVERIGDATDSA